MSDKEKVGIQPDDVRTPERLRAFYELLDKQAAEQGALAPNDAEKHLLVTMIRAHGLLWAAVQASYVLEALEKRVANLEKHNLEHIDIGR